MTDPNEAVRVALFDADGYLTSDTYAQGTPQARTFTYQYLPTSHLLQAVTDAFHSRRTEHTYHPGSSDLA